MTLAEKFQKMTDREIKDMVPRMTPAERAAAVKIIVRRVQDRDRRYRAKMKLKFLVLRFAALFFPNVPR
jgi:hypothetical protein